MPYSSTPASSARLPFGLRHARLFAAITRMPSWSRSRSAILILGSLGLIAWIDYLTGPYVAMRLFYDVPIAMAVVWLGPWTGTATAMASVGFWFVAARAGHAAWLQQPLLVWWNLSVAIASYLIVVVVLHGLITLHRELEARVVQRTLALREEEAARSRLQREILTISERERSSIGHELHDDLCQHLVGTSFAASVLAQRLAAQGDPAGADAQAIVGLIQEGIAKTRDLARGLLLAEIRSDALAFELEEYSVAVSRQSGVPCRFTSHGQTAANDEATASHLFRIAQEAVRNALRHAHPKSLEIVLMENEKHLVLIVSDDGTGIAEKRSESGMGLRIMAQRAEIIGGDLAVEPAEGGGTCVHCRVPILQPAA